jgi:hypothetical protein
MRFKSQIKFGLIILIVLFLLLLANEFWRSSSLKYSFSPKVESPEKLKNSLKKGITWLLNTEENFSGGTTFIIKKLNEICKDESLEKLWKEKIDEDLNLYPFLYRAYGIQSQFNPEDCQNYLNWHGVSGTYGGYTNFVLCEIIYCDYFNPEEIINHINSIKEDDGFYSNHKLFSLLLMKEFDCYDSQVLDKLIRKKTEELIAVQERSKEFKENQRKLDIYSQRAAIIGYSGYEIKQSWIDNIISEQEKDGSWADNPHTTSLALWAIAQKNESCN